MKRRTLDIIVTVGAVLLAAVLLVLGFVMTDNANFSKDYVGQQLKAQEITFPAVADLSEQDKVFSQARTGCLFEYAEQQMRTGKQAECYANEYIGSHVTYLPTRLGMTSVAYADGLTYSELGGLQGELKTKIEEATEKGTPGVAALEQELADVTTVRTKMFEGSMLRNALLTSFGFSVLGDKAGQAGTVSFIGAAILALIALASFVHAFVTPKSRAFAPVEPERKGETDKPVLA